MLRRIDRGELINFLKELAYDYLLLARAMGVDKASAIRNESRIPEEWFFIISMAGGPFGVFLGMMIFHHKTRKTYFGFIVALTLIIYTFIILVL